jgi:exonuclease SbcD
LDLIDSTEVHSALSPAHTYTIQPELVSQLARPRIPELSASNSIDPMEALKTYLNNREDLKDIAASMLEAAHNLLANDVEVSLEAPPHDQSQNHLSVGGRETQLPLL